MSAGLTKYVVVNLSDLDKAFSDGEKVTLDALQQKNILNISGRDTRLQLKVGALDSCKSSTPNTVDVGASSGAPYEAQTSMSSWMLLTYSMASAAVCVCTARVSAV